MRFLGYKYGYVVLWMLLLSQQIAAQNTTQTDTTKSSSTKFNVKMAAVMIVLIAVFFFLGFLSVYTRQCSQTRLSPSRRAELARERMMARGLDPAIIESFPAFLFSDVKGLHLGKDSLQCAVCLNEFQDDETLRLIPKCDHVFHPDCIDTWLISHSTCPVCRAYLVPKPGEEPYSALMAELLEHELESGQPDPEAQQQPKLVDDQIKEEEGTPKINLINVSEVASQRPIRSSSTGFGPRSMSTGFGPPRAGSTGRRLAGILFPRSQSTGHNLGLVQPGDNTEKFTLRLPEEVRNRLMNMALTRAKSTSVFPRAGSVRQGYRSGSVRGGGQNNGYDRFEESSGRSNRWAFSMTPPFLSRSVRQQPGGDNDVAAQLAAAVPESSKSPQRVVVTVVEEDKSTDALQKIGQV